MKNRVKRFLVGLTIYPAAVGAALGLSYLLWRFVPFWLLALCVMAAFTVCVALIYTREDP